MTHTPRPEEFTETELHGDGLLLSEPIGVVTQIGATQVTVAQDRSLERPMSLGEVVAVKGSGVVLLGEVSSIDSTDSGLTLSVTLTATVDLNSLVITSGILATVPHRSHVHRAHNVAIKAYFEGRRSLFDDLNDGVTIALGASPTCLQQVLSFSPERLFGRHCAVVGTSGSGKSWSMARLLEQSAAHQGKVILIDPSGEYSALQGAIRHVHIGESPLPSSASLEIANLPYFELTEADLVAILRPTNATQLTKLRAAIRSLKLVALEPRLGVDGNLPKAHRLKTPYELAFSDYRDEVTLPENRFNITNLPIQVGLECVDPIRSHTESNYWGGLNINDHNACIPLISTLEDLLQSRELDCLLRPASVPSLIDIIDDFRRDPSVSLLRISCEYLPTINRVREIMANAIARHLLGIARSGDLRTRPLILAVDEAHQMLPKTSSHLSSEYPLEAFNVIAREGRKYGLTLTIATQRPSDIPDDVLGQVGTFLVHRLVSDADRGAIERASGGVGHILRTRLPLLGSGEAFLMGVDFQTPLRLMVARPAFPPSSRGPDYQSSWCATNVQ